MRAANDPAGPPRLQVGGAGDVPPDRRGPSEAGGLRAVRRPRAGRRAGAPQVRAPDRRETQRNQSSGALASHGRREWYGRTSALASIGDLASAATPSEPGPRDGSPTRSTGASPSVAF